MSPEQLLALAVVFGVLAIAAIADALDAWRLRRKAAKRQAEFAAAHPRPRLGTPLARSTHNHGPHISSPGSAPGKTLQNERGRRR